MDDIVVLDAWPVVEYYKGSEPAAAAIAQLMAGSDGRPVMRVVNFAEVATALARRLGPSLAHRELARFQRLVVLEDATLAVAETASRLKYAYHMALGDAYAVATGLEHDAEIWTGDGEILCAQRFWRVHDLRSEAQRDAEEERRAVRRRLTGLRLETGLDDLDEIAQYVMEPLALPA